MTTFVLVHAAFHGGWAWRRVTDHLVRIGHRAFAPSFSVGRAGQAATLSSHVAELLDLLAQQAGAQVVLVAQSYGGLIATAAAARLPSRIAALVYVDAVLPEHGRSMLETIPTAFATAYSARRSTDGGRSVILPAEALPPDLRRAADRDFVASQIAPQSYATFAEPADLVTSGNALAGIPHHYLHCSAHSIDPSAQLYAAFAAKVAADPGWFYRNLPLGFYGAVSAPRDLAEALVEAAHGVRGGLSAHCLRRVLEAVDAKDGRQISVVELAETAGLSTWHFARCFKKSMGVPPHAYLLTRRMEKAARLLRQGGLRLADIARASGFSSASRFATVFGQMTGMTPRAFSKDRIR